MREDTRRPRDFEQNEYDEEAAASHANQALLMPRRGRTRNSSRSRQRSGARR
jgi:hypothetical protein